MSGFKVSVEHEISERRIMDLITAGVEGGINYWGGVSRYKWEGVEAGTVDLGDAVVIVEYVDEDENAVWPLTREAIADGLRIMGEKYPRHLRDFLADNEDAVTGDVFIQCACLGEVVYA